MFNPTALISIFLSWAGSCWAIILPSADVSVLPRNLTLVNNASDLQSSHFNLEENSATARCFDSVAASWNYHLCFVNNTPNQYTFSILTYDHEYQVSNRQFYRVVWSANRNHPVQENAVVKMQEDGDLTLHEFDGTLVWSTHTANRSVAGIYLNDWGNLAIFDILNQTLWQSYDYPTDTLLQYQYLNPNMQIISRASDQDGSEGYYSLAMKAGGLALYDISSPKEPIPYWILGCFGKNDSFSLTHTCNDQFSFILDGGYLSFAPFSGDIANTSYAVELCKLNSSSCSQLWDWKFDLSLSLVLNISFIRIEKDGFLRGYSYDSGQWLKRFDLLRSDPCLLPNACGSYGICSSSGVSCTCPDSTSRDTSSSEDTFKQVLDHSGHLTGCSPPRSSPTCEPINTLMESNQHFLNLSGVDYFTDTFSPQNNHIDLASCLHNCLNNCSCIAVFYQTESRSCFPHSTSLKTLRAVNSSTFLAFLKVKDNTETSAQKWKAHYIAIIAGVSTCIVLVCILLMVVIICGKRRSHKDDCDDTWLVHILPTLPTRYTYKELKKITQGFSKLLGSGGFGKVYEGTLANGSLVAVKRLVSNGPGQGTKEFRAEVVTLGGIHHINLVRLCGFCAEGSERLLVYDFMPNGSLDRWLFQSKEYGSQTLSWPLRFNIALGTARSLAYLHEGCKERIVHLDVKPQNILLDKKFNPKVSDFGLSRLVDRDDYQASALTTIRGTPGYLAPEWLWNGPITDKTDVFSFGLVLMEIVSGRTNLDESIIPYEETYYPAVVVRKAEEGKFSDLPDKRLGQSVDQKQAKRMINTALLCIQTEPVMRPSMEKVVQMLEGGIDVTDLPVSKITHGIHFALRSATGYHFDEGGDLFEVMVSRPEDEIRSNKLSASHCTVDLDSSLCSST